MIRDPYSLALTPAGWARLRRLSLAKDVSISKYLIELSQYDWKPADDSGLWIRVAGRSSVKFTSLKEITIQRFRDIQKSCFIVSLHRSRDVVGAVVQAILDGQLVGPALEDIHPEVLQITHPAENLRLSKHAWNGLKDQFGAYPSTRLNLLAGKQATFFLTAQGQDPILTRRHAHKLRLTVATLTYFARVGKALGLKPVVRHGLISWASIFLEYLGRGFIGIRETSSNGRLLDDGPVYAGDERTELHVG